MMPYGHERKKVSCKRVNFRVLERVEMEMEKGVLKENIKETKKFLL